MGRLCGLRRSMGLVLGMLAVLGCDIPDVDLEMFWGGHGNGRPGSRTLGTINGEIIIAEPEAIEGPISVAVTWSAAEDLGDFYGYDDEYYDDSAPDTDAEGGGAEDSGEGDETDETWEDDWDFCPGIYNTNFDDFETCDGTMGPYYEETCRTALSENESSNAIEVAPASTAAFALTLKRRPPRSARVDLTAVGGKGWYAEGFVIGFLDDNGNGTFDPATPDEMTDTLLFSSYAESETDYYLARVVVLAGSFPDNGMMEDWFGVSLEQGLNIIVENENEIRRLGTDETITLYPLDAGDPLSFAYLACTEIEYRSKVNVPFPEDGEVTSCMASISGFVGEDGEMEMTAISQWTIETVNPDNLCVVDIRSAAICMTDESQYPDAWEAVCGSVFW